MTVKERRNMNISKRYRKAAALLAALTALCLALSACGSAPAPAPSSVQEVQRPQQSEKEEAKQEQPKEEAKEEAKEEPKEEQKAEPPAPAYDIKGLVIAEKDNFRITIDGVEESWSGGLKFSLLCENMDPERTLMFSISDTAVNGYMVSTLFVEEVAPGKKTFEDLSLSGDDLETIGIESVDRLDMKIRVYDSNDWHIDPFMDERVSIYPTGMSEEDIVVPERRTVEGELTAEDNDQFCFVLLGTRNDSIWGYTIDCYIENRSATDLMFTWDEVSVNGFMIDPFWADTVVSGCREYDSISFSKSKLESSHIDKIEEIEFKLRVYDPAHIMSKDAYSKVFTLTLE